MTQNTVHVPGDTRARLRRTRPRATAFAVGLATVLTGALVFAGGASALATHVFATSFGTPAGDVGLSLASNSGVAVNQTTHDVYLADTGNLRVDEFSSSGT